MGEKVLIKKIEVTKLFGILNHSIELNLDEHITIIYGPNGIGKTIILSMIYGLFNSDYRILKSTPFEKFILYFDDGSTLKVTKEYDSHPRNKIPSGTYKLVLSYEDSSSKNHAHKITLISPVELSHFSPGLLRIIDREISGLERINEYQWYNAFSNETLDLEDIIARYRDRFPPDLSNRLTKKEKEWFKELKKSINIGFIQTERLQNLTFRRSYPGREYNEIPRSAVVYYSRKLVEAIKEKLAEYSTNSQSLDRSFPVRLVEHTQSGGLTVEQITKELRNLEEKRTKLMTTGFLDKEKEPDFSKIMKADLSNGSMLEVFIEDVREKLKVFDDLTNEIDILVNIINKKFLYKKMSISKTEGFVFKLNNGEKLPIEKLSSGEQHELVLLYELLFEKPAGSLILIDEPEISLHLVWQQEFLKDLSKIAELRKLNFLIATHSPQIIHDRGDLMVELKGPP